MSSPQQKWINQATQMQQQALNALTAQSNILGAANGFTNIGSTTSSGGTSITFPAYQQTLTIQGGNIMGTFVSALKKEPDAFKEIVAGPVMAYRQWTFYLKGETAEAQDDACLIGHYRGQWHPGIPMTTSCPHGDGLHTKCSCGVYAYKKLKMVPGWNVFHRTAVIGKVALWGKIAQYSEGYRAAEAYPIEFYMPRSPMPYFPKRSGLITRYEQLAEAFGIHVLPLPQLQEALHEVVIAD